MSQPTKALSVRAPWWWLILHGGKDIENRDWPTKFRGTVYLHASKWWSVREISSALMAIQCLGLGPILGAGRMMAARGCIVGTVDIVDCTQDRECSKWFFGQYGFKLANPVAFAKPVPCKGALGFFTLPNDVLAACEVQR